MRREEQKQWQVRCLSGFGANQGQFFVEKQHPNFERILSIVSKKSKDFAANYLEWKTNLPALMKK